MTVLQITLSLAYIAILVIGLRIAFRTQHRLLFVPALLAVINEGFRHVFPAISIFIPESSGGLTADQVSAMAIGSALDLTYLLSWLVGFCILAYLSKSRVEQLKNEISVYSSGSLLAPFEHIDHGYYLRRIRPMMLLAFVCTLFIYPLSMVMNWPTGYGQWDLFSFELWSQARLPYLGKTLIRIVIAAPAIACVYILLRADKFFSKRNWLPLVTIVAYIFWGLARGGRGISLMPLVLLIMCAFMQRRRLRSAFMIFAGFLLLMIIFSPQIRASRYSEEFREEKSVIGRVKLLFTLETGEMTIWDWKQIERFNNALFTGEVYDQVQDRGHAGLRIYRGLPFIAVPQFVWRTKIPLGSIDNTATGRLYTLLYYWKTGSYGVTLTPGPGAQPYWVGGWVAVVIIGFMGGLVVALLWGYLRLAYNPFGLIIFFGVIIKGTELSFLYNDWTLMLEEFVQRALLIAFLYILTFPFAIRTPVTESLPSGLMPDVNTLSDLDAQE